MTKPSAITERMTCLREPPSVRSVANSRVRWATLEVKTQRAGGDDADELNSSMSI